MIRTFRDAFLGALETTGQSLVTIARETGVPLGELKKLKQRTTARINVDDAKKVAAYFGVGLDEFLGDPELKAPIEIVELYNQLPAHLKRQFRAYGQELLGSEDQTEPK